MTTTPSQRVITHERASDAIPIVPSAPWVVFTIPWQLPEPTRRTEGPSDRPVRVIVVKATFDLVQDGPAVLRLEADPPSGDVHIDNVPERGLIAASDFAIRKPKVDVTLHGHAIAPGGSSPASLVRFTLGRGEHRIDRRIAVFGDRRWEGGGLKLSPSKPRPFQTMPLVWERAFGGPGIDGNPTGRGLPNLEDPDHLVTGPEDSPNPANFGPIPMRWNQRWSKLGTYSGNWLEERWPYAPLDFDWSFFQHAPKEQRLDHARGDEPFEIAGVSAEHPILRGRLPGLRPRCLARTIPESFREIELVLDTIAFDTDDMKVNLVFRGLTFVRDDEASDIAELFVIMEPIAQPEPLVALIAKYEAERVKATQVTEALRAPEAANDAPPLSAATQAYDALIRARLVASGVLESHSTENGGPPPQAFGAEPPAKPPHDPTKRPRVLEILAEGLSLEGLDLTGADLEDLDFTDCSLSRADLRGANLARSRFERANLVETLFSSANLEGATFNGANLERADLTDASLIRTRFSGTNLASADLTRVNGEGADFRGASAVRATFVSSSWRGARFEEAMLDAADFTEANLDDASFDGASLVDIRFYEARAERASFKDTKLVNARADGAHFIRSFFSNADLTGSIWDKSNLDESTFLGATLKGAGFVKASCCRTIFSGADLKTARFGHARLAGASFLKANLMEAQLESADLRMADLRGANLHAAETWKTCLDGARLDFAILTQTKQKDRG